MSFVPGRLHSQLHGPTVPLTWGEVPRRGPRVGPNPHVRDEMGPGNRACKRPSMNSVVHNQYLDDFILLYYLSLNYYRDTGILSYYNIILNHSI